jgi:farnesyl diphosphate synthase
VVIGTDLRTRFLPRLHAAATDVEVLLDRLLTAGPAGGETYRPQRLAAAMRYATLGGGKRLRPFLVIETAALFGVPREHALMAGTALECVHCYSLVHDDLPAMDNDDLRRGQSTVHKAFDEATAILVGDSLLTFAFEILARPETHPKAGVRIDLVGALARASGVGGMAGGQMLDLAAEGRFEVRGRPHELTDITTLQDMKTGALLRFACLAGALLGEADEYATAALERYGNALGRAFQIGDDLLDVEGEVAMVGKSTRKDATAGKATFVSVLGVEGAKAQLNALVEEAAAALDRFGSAGEVLKEAARFVAERRS